MAYSEELDARVTDVVADWGATTKKMFGGTCHLLNGNMLCGVNQDSLIVRLGAEAGEAALSEPHAGPMDVTGRPLKGWVTVGPKGLEGDGLRSWLERAHDFVSTLPSK
jgi:hypothetical protein